ncbi:MAG: c-type cytochrome [Verrucomicrobiota bacterium]
MTEEQLTAAMQIRGEYIIDESQIAELNMVERGARLSILCAGCHGAPGQHHGGLPAPTLDGIWDRPIASDKGYEYSDGLTEIRNTRNKTWTPDLMEEFLASPKRFAPGTKMEFQGLLNDEDIKALVEHLKQSR